jgi:eukaryotic-like serine/threonine-protein kinase
MKRGYVPKQNEFIIVKSDKFYRFLRKGEPMIILKRFPIFSQTKSLAFLIIFSLMLILVVSCAPATPAPNTAPLTIPSVSGPPIGLGDTKVSAKDNVTMDYVPAGPFIMGSQNGLTDEQPAHIVLLDAFWMDQTEVTNKMYTQCVEAGKCEQLSNLIYYNDPAYSNHPVSSVSWTDAVAYCSWVDRRLPTEAEWEKAATWNPSKNEKLVYPWGDTYDCSKGNFDDETALDASVMQDGSVSCDGFAKTAPVGSFPAGASPYGVLDMGGNVWEWVHDAFIEVDPLDATIQNYYAISPSVNPMGVDPAITEYRSMRGGSWNWTFGYGRSAYRLWFGKDDKYDAVGFRCAVSK